MISQSIKTSKQFLKIFHLPKFQGAFCHLHVVSNLPYVCTDVTSKDTDNRICNAVSPKTH